MTIDLFQPIPENARRKLLRYSRALMEAYLAPAPVYLSGCDEGVLLFDGATVRERVPSAAHSAAPSVVEPEPPAGSEVFTRPLGVFVTLRRGGALRGCIGSLTAEEPLVRGIRRRTLDAAFHDKRFPPLARWEMRDLSIEHSVLSTPRKINCPEEIVPGEHGVILTVSGERGVFLPEVATQQGWDVPALLNALSEKAGLDRDAWRRPHARLEVFRTQHYGEGL